MKPGMNIRLLMGLVISIAVTGCMAPQTFVKTPEPLWSTIYLGPDIPYDRAWEVVIDTLTKRFDIEIMSRQDGYARTSWMYTWTGTVDQKYRVRITAKFAPGRKIVQIKSEAEYGGPGAWVAGYDTRLLETVKAELKDTIGQMDNQQSNQSTGMKLQTGKQEGIAPQGVQNEAVKPQSGQLESVKPQKVQGEGAQPKATESPAPQGVQNDGTQQQAEQNGSPAVQETQGEAAKPQSDQTGNSAPQGAQTESPAPQGTQNDSMNQQGVQGEGKKPEGGRNE